MSVRRTAPAPFPERAASQNASQASGGGASNEGMPGNVELLNCVTRGAASADKSAMCNLVCCAGGRTSLRPCARCHITSKRRIIPCEQIISGRLTNHASNSINPSKTKDGRCHLLNVNPKNSKSRFFSYALPPMVPAKPMSHVNTQTSPATHLVYQNRRSSTCQSHSSALRKSHQEEARRGMQGDARQCKVM